MYFNLIDERIQRYCESHSESESVALKKLSEETLAQYRYPQMLSGHLQGLFLKQISWMIRPRKVLEIGSYTGYSTLCLADGLAEDGSLISIDRNESLAPTLRKHINASPYADKITLVFSNAHEWLLQNHLEDLDLVFIDADKASSLAYYKSILPMVRSGGFIITDNVLWNAKVTEPIKPSDRETIGLDIFNKYVTSDPSVENILLPFRDGIMMMRKR